AIKEDYANLLPISREIVEKHTQALPHIFQQGTAGLPEVYFLGLLESDSKVMYVAEYEQDIVGYAIMELSEVSFRDILVPRNVAFIADIVVLKSHQGKAIGYALFQQCIEWAKAKGADSVDLLVWEFNEDAIAFYERQGMKSIHRTMSLRLK
ncbi:MAG: GNAT family N-acetyltransferase, partial [Chloroflexi bacterium]